MADVWGFPRRIHYTFFQLPRCSLRDSPFPLSVLEQSPSLQKPGQSPKGPGIEDLGPAFLSTSPPPILPATPASPWRTIQLLRHKLPECSHFRGPFPRLELTHPPTSLTSTNSSIPPPALSLPPSSAFAWVLLVHLTCPSHLLTSFSSFFVPPEKTNAPHSRAGNFKRHLVHPSEHSSCHHYCLKPLSV